MKYDFAGYITRNDIKCSDGRIIRQNAFAKQHGQTLPLVWQHQHNSPKNILGNVLVENRKDGVYGYASFNNTDMAKTAKSLVEHGDIRCMSIYANGLKQVGSDVVHGCIKEVSLVISGANPGAVIENLAIEHSDGRYEDIEDEAIITSGEELDGPGETNNKGSDNPEIKHSEGNETVEDIFNTLNQKQKNVVYAMIVDALNSKEEMAQDDLEGGRKMAHKNIFERDDENTKTLSHSDLNEILEEAKKKENGSWKTTFLAHTQEYGIENIEFLFPDAKNVTTPPDYIKRDTEWVAEILNGVKHSPFSRIKSMAADITADEARARGYIKGNLKKEEVIKLLKRTVGPTTIYKKQKLDRDDIIDITDFNVVSWLWSEMRMMLNEEVARAVLIGDGRSLTLSNGEINPDKIDEDNIRPIWKEPELYAERIIIPKDADPDAMVEAVIRNRKEYKGSGSPKLYAEPNWITDILLLKDKIGRRVYRTRQEIANEMNVSGITDIPVMENQTRVEGEGTNAKTYKLLGIIINLKDYTIGTDRGGEIATFDQFDIDFNQYKYLMETRMSGTLTHPKSALIIEQDITETIGTV